MQPDLQRALHCPSETVRCSKEHLWSSLLLLVWIVLIRLYKLGGIDLCRLLQLELDCPTASICPILRDAKI